MGYQVYSIGHHRFGGYGVPAICEHPDCNEKIDRGIPYACGGEPFSERGCDRYFCSKHREYEAFDENGEKCSHEEDCDCEAVELCERCARGEEPFPYKPEDPEWVEHLLTDESWQEWRDENPEEVKELQKLIKKNKNENKS